MKELHFLKIVFCGVIFGMFAGGIYQAIPKPKIVHDEKYVSVEDTIDINQIKNNIIDSCSMADYNKLKDIYGGKLQKEDLFYALYMYQQHGGDTIYHDIRNALFEIYNLPPKDTTTLYLIKELDRTHLADYARLKQQNR